MWVGIGRVDTTSGRNGATMERKLSRQICCSVAGFLQREANSSTAWKDEDSIKEGVHSLCPFKDVALESERERQTDDCTDVEVLAQLQHRVQYLKLNFHF